MDETYQQNHLKTDYCIKVKYTILIWSHNSNLENRQAGSHWEFSKIKT